MYKNIIVANLLCTFLALQATMGSIIVDDGCPDNNATETIARVVNDKLLETLDRAIDAHNQEKQSLLE